MTAIFKVSFNAISTVAVAGQEPHRADNEIEFSEDMGISAEDALELFQTIDSGKGAQDETVAAKNAEEAIANVRTSVVGTITKWQQDDDEGMPEVERGKDMVSTVVDIAVVRVEPVAFTTI